MCPWGRGLGLGSGGGWGGGFPVENEEKRKGVGWGGWWGCSGDRQSNRQVDAQALSKLALAIYPLVSLLIDI